MKCKNCGKPIEDGANFCGNCGEKAQEKTSPVPETSAQPIIAPPLEPVEKQDKQAKEKMPSPQDIPEPAEKVSAPIVSPAPVRKKTGGFLKFVKVFASIVLAIPIIAFSALFAISFFEEDIPESEIYENEAPEEPYENGKVSQIDIQSALGEEDVSLSVNEISPSSGTVGTLIMISGENLDASNLLSVAINGKELNINAVTSGFIEAVITYGAESGDIILTFADGEVAAGLFEVVPQEKELICQEEIGPSDKEQKVSAENISITLPAGAAEGTKTLKIEEIVSPKTINLPHVKNSTAFSITLDDVHEFDEILTITYDLPGDAEGAPSAAYFNEQTSLWDTLPSEVIDGKLNIYTNHLTDFIIFYWGEAIYSSEGYFKIYYEKDDTVKFGGSMDALAQKVGEALEAARKDYEAKIPAGYRENFSYMGIKDAMDVYIDSGYSNCKYNPITNNILIPTDFSDIDDFETCLAHELFHSYQDSVWNEINAIGTMGKSANRWAIEALAELAAYEIAFPEKGRHREITGGVSPQDRYNTFDEIHEYSMSCYLRYLLQKTNTKAENLWVYVAGSGESLIENSINNFFRSKSSEFISLEDSYTKFWRDVLGDKSAPEQENLSSTVDTKYLKINDHSADFQYKALKTDTMAFYMVKVLEYPENVPIRIFNMECVQGSKNSVWSTFVPGAKNINALNSMRVPGGYFWDYFSNAQDTAGGNYKRYSFKQGADDALLIGLDSILKNETAKVMLSEISSQCVPAKIEEGTAGKEYEFELTFSNVFANVKHALIVADFGDGQTAEFQKTNTNFVLSETINHAYDTKIDTVAKFMLYDVTGAEKELIAQINAPVSVTNELIVTASPNPVAPKKEVSFSMIGTIADYTYKWSFGDGATIEEKGKTSALHTYENAGIYSVSVKVYDPEGEHLGTARLNVNVSEAELSGALGRWKWSGVLISGEDGDWRFVAILAFYSDGTCSLGFGSEGLVDDSVSDVYGTYKYDNETSSGTVTFKNYEDGGYATEPFSISGGILTVDGQDYVKIQ